MQNTNNMWTRSAEELILNERCSAAPDESSAPQRCGPSPIQTPPQLIFQCGEDSVFAAPLLRQALIASVQGSRTGFQLSPLPRCAGTDPGGLTVDGLGLPCEAGDPAPFWLCTELYMEARQGMSNSAFDKVTLLIPAGCGLEEVAAQITASGKAAVPLISLEQVPPDLF